MGGDNDVGSAVTFAVIAAILLWVAGLFGLPANVRIFVYVIVGFIALFAVLHLVDTVWLSLKRRRETTDGE